MTAEISKGMSVQARDDRRQRLRLASASLLLRLTLNAHKLKQPAQAATAADPSYPSPSFLLHINPYRGKRCFRRTTDSSPPPLLFALSRPRRLAPRSLDRYDAQQQISADHVAQYTISESTLFFLAR